ncbi:uncharacterized protein TNCV_2367031 [Trichonephila clavipes]|nr:uncharacterized protein TNCV_2367031 [Trichonephila clavipes]
MTTHLLTRHLQRRTTRGLLATDHVILNHGQVTWTTPELAPPLLTTTPHQREDVSALDRFNVHRQIIGYEGVEDWPEHSPDLTPLDFLLLGYLKQQVYAPPPQLLQHFRGHVTDVCANVSPSML